MTKFCILQKCAQTKKCADVKSCICRICALCRKLHLQKSVRCRFAHFVHRRFLHICRFVHLCFALVQKSFDMCELFLHVRHICENVLKVCACKILFFTDFAEFSEFDDFDENVEKVEISENVPKMSEKSSRVPEWYTSGSWANAFDNTGWQKSPEYALIRIAAGAPDLAKSGQIRPRTAPDGKSSRIWRRFRFCSTGWNPVRSCFFLTRAQISDPSTCSRGASSSATESDTFCKCAHTSQNTRWKPPSGLRTFCTLCTPCTTETDTRAQTVHTRNTDVHTCAQPRHNSRHKWQRTHRPCVALVGEVGGAERPRAIEIVLLFYLILFFTLR